MSGHYQNPNLLVYQLQGNKFCNSMYIFFWRCHTWCTSDASIFGERFSLQLVTTYPGVIPFVSYIRVYYKRNVFLAVLVSWKRISPLESQNGYLFQWNNKSLPTYFCRRTYGSIQVSGKLPTYPSPKPSFCPKWEVSVNVSLGEG